MQALIAGISTGVPSALIEVTTLGRTLKHRAGDVTRVLRPAWNQQWTYRSTQWPEHLRGSALGFRNLANYIAQSLLETGGFRPRVHP